MHTTSCPRQRTAPARASLLGTYRVPELHLVGAPIPRDLRSPLHWQPTPPPPQYGIDYTFMHRDGREPTRWPQSATITVRIAGTDDPDTHTALARVVAELRALTRLDLVTGDPAAASLVPSAVPHGEIHVGYLAARKLAGSPTQGADEAGIGGVALCDRGCCYVSGFAIVNIGLTGPDAISEHALAILRHELGHALGLGHAARPSLLMHHQIPGSAARYGPGDQYGLALLGQQSGPAALAAELAKVPHLSGQPERSSRPAARPSQGTRSRCLVRAVFW